MKRVVVLGGGESGCGSAILAQKMGYDVFLSDKGKLEEKYSDMLDNYHIEYECGKHSFEKILNADIVVKSPGIPEKVEIIQKLYAQSTPVVSELEFAKPFSKAKTICITGSNGKTTTTTLIYKILKEAGYNVGLAGNIGKSYALQVALCDFDWYVIEISSFQLDGMYDFKADISVLTNITPDHLDRYDYKMENYVNSKFRICQNQQSSEYFISYADDPEINKHYAGGFQTDASCVKYSVTDTCSAAHLVGDTITVSILDKTLSINKNDLQIKGLHNVANSMAAILACMLAGVDTNSIAGSLKSFAGVEHRVENICTVNNIQYINDSKATNVDSVWYALESMTRPVVWIAGGTDKGNDYSPIMDLVKQKVHTLICMGLDNKKLLDTFTGIVPEVVDTDSLEKAICAVKSSAKSGDVVLLSPACASFDLFCNYEQRGELFKKAILDIVK